MEMRRRVVMRYDQEDEFGEEGEKMVNGSDSDEEANGDDIR